MCAMKLSSQTKFREPEPFSVNQLASTYPDIRVNSQLIPLI